MVGTFKPTSCHVALNKIGSPLYRKKEMRSAIKALSWYSPLSALEIFLLALQSVFLSHFLLPLEVSYIDDILCVGDLSDITTSILRSSGQFEREISLCDRLCGLAVRVPGYRSIGPGSIPGATRFSEK
jgi:hypothetical protein